MKKITYLMSVVLVLALIGNSDADTISDNFDDNSIDPNIWVIVSGTPTETAGVMRLNSANSHAAYSNGKYLVDDI